MVRWAVEPLFAGAVCANAVERPTGPLALKLRLLLARGFSVLLIPPALCISLHMEDLSFYFKNNTFTICSSRAALRVHSQ